MDHYVVSSMDESMSHQTHGDITKWCWKDKRMDRLQ